jgi:hypothetical protein
MPELHQYDNVMLVLRKSRQHNASRTSAAVVKSDVLEKTQADEREAEHSNT